LAGRVLFIDSLSTLDSSADRNVNTEHIVERRILNDGSKHSVVKVIVILKRFNDKVYYNLEQLEKQLKKLGFTGNTTRTKTNFFMGDFQKE
jgi:hypothetical protein